LVDPKMSGLPAFLAPDSGVNSGFMLAQVTAAALVAENRMLCHPASVDSIPTSANQEDHVSMATHGARRLLAMAGNGLNIVALDALVDLFPVHGNALGRVDADPYLIALDPQNRNGHVVADHDGLANPACENEHLPIPLSL